MQFIDLAAQQKLIRSDLEQRIAAVLDHGRYVMGPEITELEEKLAAYCGARFAVGCASGTDALLMALLAYGVGPGDAVLTTPFTFIATAEVISLLRATPIFVDVDPVTYNLDPIALNKTLAALKAGGDASPKPRGIIAVDLFGLPADYPAINRLAEAEGLFVIEDAAQSFGGQQEGGLAGALAPMACTSFFPAKPLGGYGDGGMCFTSDEKLKDLLVSVRVHGQGTDKYENARIGINGRLDTMQAAVLLAKFQLFPREMELRQEVAARYSRLLVQAAMEAGMELTVPSIPEGHVSAWAQYSVLAKDAGARETLLANLKKAGIPSAIYYPIPLHLQTAYKSLGGKPGDFPVSENLAQRIFALPMHPYLTEEEQKGVARALFGLA